MKNKPDIPILDTTMIGSIEVEVMTFLISDNVKTEKYFKKDTESAIVDSICNM